MTQKPNDTAHRTGRELDMALTSARQNIALLLSQARANRIDREYLMGRLVSLNTLMDELAADRQTVGQQKSLAALYDVSRLIGSSLDLQTVLNQVMDAIIKLTGAERGFLMMMDDDGNLHPRVARNIDQETLESGAFHVSRTVTQQVVETGQAVLTTNAQEDPRFAGQASVVANALRSIMATPLRVRGQVTGVVYVDNRARTGLFKPEDLSALDAFAGQAAVAIDNARLFGETDEALQARVAELRMLGRVDRELNEAIGGGAVMQITLEWATRMAEATGSALGLVEDGPEDAPVLRIAAVYGDSGLPAGIEDNAVITLGEYSALWHVLKDTEAHHRQESNGNTLLFVPIHHEGRPIGLVILAADHDFTEDQRDLVTRMAARAAIAIQNTRLFDAVKAADKAKSEFVSVVAHELKVPMTSISGYADLLKVVGPITDQQQEFIEKVKSNVTRMKVLVTDLSDISRIESGNLRMDIAPTDPASVITQARDGAMTQIEERAHDYVEDVPDDLPPVMADQTRLTQVLLNLLSNAYKYTPDGGTITMKAWQDGAAVAFSVQDTGVGMTEEEVANLGKKFWRADNDHAINQPGTGLGFAITRNLITLMGGELVIESEPGQGSAFTFTIPAES
jgi:signal transduction histidine kinase